MIWCSACNLANTAFTNPLNKARTKLYDDQGRVVREFSPQCDDAASPIYQQYMVKAYEYDGLGRVMKIREGACVSPTPDAAITNERWCAFTYDPFRGLELEKKYSDGRRIVYEYRSDNQLLSSVNVYSLDGQNQESLSYWRKLEYDPATWHLAAVSTPEGRIDYGWDEAGRLARLKTSTGRETQYTYDAMGNLASVRSTKAGADVILTTYDYDPSTGRKLKQVNSNGTEIDYDYDAVGYLHQILHKNATRDLLKLEYTRDRRGLILATKETRNDAGQNEVTDWTYTYDSAKRLHTAESKVNGSTQHTYTYAYDDAGNRTSQVADGVTTNYAYNTLDQLKSDGTLTYLYDAYGNLEYEKQGATVKRHYYWDSENHLIKADLSESGQTQTVAFGYDDLGTRVKRQQGSDTTRYLTDYSNPTGYSQSLAELDETATTPSHEYVYGSDLLAQADGTAVAPDFFHGDNLGSTRLLTTSTGNAKLNSRYNYTPYGVSLGGDGSLTSYAFTGQYRDASLGLQYHRARWFIPRRAIWASLDPVFDYLDNFGNPYSYAGTNSISKIDPNGSNSLVETSLVSGIICGLVGAVIGVTLNGVKNVYMSGGQWCTFFDGWKTAALWGAVFGAVGGVLSGALFSLLLAEYGVAYAASATFWVVSIIYGIPLYMIATLSSFANAKTKKEIHVAIGESIIGLIFFAAGARAVSTVSSPAIPRNPLDINGSREGAPPQLPWLGRRIGRNARHIQECQDLARTVSAQGATDIRVDQTQVNIHGNKVGINRPDLQYTLNGKRYYHEWDDPATSIRGFGHHQRILSNDPKGVVTLHK